MGWEEIEGLASRTDFDLKQHAAASGKVLDYYDDETKEHYVPYVIEPAVGVDRSLLAFMCDAYAEEPDKDETRIVMRFHPSLAPGQSGYPAPEQERKSLQFCPRYL